MRQPSGSMMPKAARRSPIAVRGERLHLSRVTWGRAGDFHVTALVVFAFDASGPE